MKDRKNSIVGDDGVGPSASFLSGKRSTAELITQRNWIIILYLLYQSQLIIEAQEGIEPSHSCFCPALCLANNGGSERNRTAA